MAAKRSATSDLNHDNWDNEDEPEDAGSFSLAPQSILSTRVIRTAKRRTAGQSGDDKPAKNVFSSFTGFAAGGPPTNPANAFGFLAKSTPSTSASTTTQNGFTTPASSTTNIKSNTNGDGNKISEYYSKLKGLNESVSQWIKTHVDENPLCNLTPVFKDYEKYLKEIEESKPTENKPSESSKPPESKPPESKPFEIKPTEPPKPKYTFGMEMQPDDKPSNPFVTSFGNTAAFGSGAPSTSGFSFGGSKPFQFANITPATSTETKEEEESDEPPKVEFTKVVEEGNVYNIRCKVFAKKDKNFVERGVGQLYLKPIEGSDKTQLIVRADTNLGNLIMNVILSKSIPTSRQGKNHVMIVCIPTPEEAPKPGKESKGSPLQTMLIKVKTSDDAEKLLEMLEKYKK